MEKAWEMGYQKRVRITSDLYRRNSLTLHVEESFRWGTKKNLDAIVALCSMLCKGVSPEPRGSWAEKR